MSKKQNIPSKKEMMVNVNFEELDQMREKIREIVERVKGSRRFAYEQSGFYIGRGVTRFSFHNINVNVMQMKKIVNEVFSQFSDKYDVYRDGRSLHVYLRGKPRV